MEGDYRFAGMPLRPAMFAELAIELLGHGRPVERRQIIDTVTAYHVENGGAPPNADVISVTKKALTYLIRSGAARSVPNAYGMYVIDGSSQVLGGEQDFSDGIDDGLDDETVQPPVATYVYVYDLPTYAEHAVALGRDRWPHKIGFTAVSAQDRIAAQVGTALPEHPRIVVSVACDNAIALERALHAVLELRGHRITGGPGTEWFNTNPAEVRGLIDWILDGAAATINEAKENL